MGKRKEKFDAWRRAFLKNIYWSRPETVPSSLIVRITLSTYTPHAPLTWPMTLATRTTIANFAQTFHQRTRWNVTFSFLPATVIPATSYPVKCLIPSYAIPSEMSHNRIKETRWSVTSNNRIRWSVSLPIHCSAEGACGSMSANVAGMIKCDFCMFCIMFVCKWRLKCWWQNCHVIVQLIVNFNYN